MSLLYKKIITKTLALFIIFSPDSYGKEAELTNYDKGILATEWSSVHDIAFAVVVIFVILLIIVFMKTPDDIV